MKTEKSDATAISRFNDEQNQFVKDRLLHGSTPWEVVDLFMAVYPDFQPEGMNLNSYTNRLYGRIAKYSQRNEKIKAARAEIDQRVAKLIHTDKYRQLATLCNYVEHEWRPRTFVKTATDSRGNEHDIYKDNIAQLMQCYNMINKIAAELGLDQTGDNKPSTSVGKPINKRIAQAQAEGAPSLDDDPPTNEFPSRVGPPSKEEDEKRPSLKRPNKIPIKA